MGKPFDMKVLLKKLVNTLSKAEKINGPKKTGKLNDQIDCCIGKISY